MNGVSLVTGGAGFVGKHLVEKLRARGERVRNFDLSVPLHADDIQGSILDPIAVDAVMEGVGSVFHLAGNAQLWARDNSIFDQVNFEGTKNVVDAARGAGIGRFVYCSSLTTLVGVKAPIGVSNVDETLKLSPEDMLGSYPHSKLMAEDYVLQSRDHLNVVSAIPTEPLGAGDESLTPPTRMILDFANGKTPAFIDCVLNFVSVESLADGLIAARDQGRRGERYLLGGENVSLVSLLGEIEQITGRAMPTLKLPYVFALLAGIVDTKIVAPITGKPPKAPLTGVRLAGRQVYFSSEKAAADLGWRSSSYKEALRSMLKWAEKENLLIAS